MLEDSDYHWTVYAMCCPWSGEPRYIGVTCDMKRRKKEHMQAAREGLKTKAYSWIRTLLDEGARPDWIELEHGRGIEAACVAERHWITREGVSGKLLNVSPGGEALKSIQAFRHSMSKEAKEASRMAGVSQDYTGGMARPKPVFCLETGIVFDSMHSAARWLDVDFKRIKQSAALGYRCCGYRFAYVDA